MNSPASQPMSNRAIRCAGCQQENPSDRKFCGQCGAKLWEACLQCDSINAVDEKFCGSCGTNLAQSLEEQEAKFHGKLELAIKLEKSGRYLEAANALRSITAQGDDRLQKFQANATKLLQQLESRRIVRTDESEQLAAQARTYFKAHRYAKSLESLSAIPEGLRTPETKQFMEEVAGLHEEVLRLTKFIKDSLQAKQFDGLLANVRRLCEIQPQNEDAKKLAARLEHQERSDSSRRASTLAALAQKKLAARKYQEAAHAVAEIDDQFRSGKIGQVCLQVKEVAWYADQLVYNTVATPVLQKLAMRWKKAVPEDPRPAKAAAQIAERLRTRPRDPRMARPPWQAAPQRTPLDCRVEAWTGFAGVEVEEELLPELAKHAGTLMVAYGLALQGVGAATVKHDLNPKRKGWGASLLKSRKAESAWGLDIGSTGIKALQITPDKAGETLTVTGCVVLAHSEPLDAVAPDAQAEIIEETLDQFVEEVAEKKKPRVAVGFSLRRGLARFFDLPPAKGKKVDEAVGYEMRHQIPLPIEDTVYDFHVWDVAIDAAGFRPVAAIAARREELEKWVAPVVDAGCEVALVQADGFALYNALHREFLTKQKEDTEKPAAFVVLDIGRTNSNLLIGERNYMWVRSIAHGTKRWSEAVVRDLGLTAEQADKAREDPSLVRWMHQLDESLSADFGDLADEVQRTLLAYPRRSDSTLKILLGVGGGFSQYGLLRLLIYGDVANRNLLKK